MAVTERVSGPYLGLGTGDNCMDEPFLIREQEEQLRVIGSQVAGELRLDPSSAAQALPKSPQDYKNSLRYDPLTLLHLARTQPQIPRHKLQFSDEAPIEVIPWKAFEPRYFTMGGHTHSISITSDDEDPLSGGVPINRGFAQFQRSTSSSVFPEQPVRQPRGPPTGKDAQIEKGFKQGPRPTKGLNELAKFAKFIKERASPPQVRVTAGGRVVPVGPKSPPPTFHMDFIDRLIQVAEENKQNPNHSNGAQPINWLGKTQHNPSKKHSVTFNTEPSAAPAKRPFAAENDGSNKKFKQDDSKPEPSWPDFLRLRAEIGDGSKILSVGEGKDETWFRAYIKDGKTALEKMAPADTLPDSMSVSQMSHVPQLAIDSQSALHPAYPSALDIHPDPNMAEGVVAHAGKEYLFAGGPNGTCYPVIPVTDQYGNVTFERFNGNVYQAPAPQPGSQLQVHPSVSSWNALSDPRSAGALVPRTYHSIPGLVTAPPAQTAPPVLPLSLHGMSHNEISRALESTTAFYKLKKDRLHSIEKWLAKEEDFMEPAQKRELYREKGELIRVCDSTRKEKERYEQSLAQITAYMNANQISLPPSMSQPQLGMVRMSTPSVHGPRHSMSQHFPSMSQHEQALSAGLLPQQAGIPAELMQANGQGRLTHSGKAPSSTQNLFYQAISNKALKADAPNFVPSGLASNAHNNGVRHKNSNMSLNGKASNNSLNKASQHVRGSGKNNGSSGGSSAEALNAKHASPLVTPRPASKALSIRHPDGHIIDFKNNQNGSNGKSPAVSEQKSLESQPSNPFISAASPTEPSFAMAIQPSRSSIGQTVAMTNAAMTSQPSNPYLATVPSAGSLNGTGRRSAARSSENFTWARHNGESDEDFDRRCRAQRAGVATSDVVGEVVEARNVTITPAVSRPALLPAPAASNENQQFRRPQSQNVVAKAPPPPLIVPQQPSLGHIAPYQYHVQQGAYPNGLRPTTSQYYHPTTMAMLSHHRSTGDMSRHLSAMMTQMDLNAQNSAMAMHHDADAMGGPQAAGLPAAAAPYPRRYSPHPTQQS